MTTPHAVESLASARLWIAFVTMLLVGGLTNAFPVLLPPLLDEFGGSRAAAASAVSIFWIGSALLVPVSGRLIDRGDPRLVVGAGLISAALGTAGAALAPSLAVFSLLLGVGGGIGAGLTGFVAQAAVIADTYRERRGFATGIAFAGAMIGYALAIPAHWAITTVGWRWTLAGWGVALLALVPLVFRHYPQRLRTSGGRRGPPKSPDARTHPGEPGARLDGSPAPDTVGRIVRRASFWTLALVFTLPPIAGGLVTLHHALYFPVRGFTPGEAATMLMVGGILSAIGRALAGLASDRFGAPAAGIGSWVLSLGGTLCLIAFELTHAPPLAYAYLALAFLPMGSRATIVSVLATRIAPPGLYGSIFGLLAIGNSLGAALGPFLSGTLYDVTGSYLTIFAAAAVVVLAAMTALAVFLRTAPRGRE